MHWRALRCNVSNGCKTSSSPRVCIASVIDNVWLVCGESSGNGYTVPGNRYGQRSHCLSEQTHNPDTRCRKRAHTAASEPGTRFSCVGAFRGRFFFALLLVLVTPAAGALAPLAGPDTSSLRATFESFLALSEEAARRLSDHRDAPSHATATRIFQIANSAESLFDLREVPVAAQREVAAETF